MSGQITWAAIQALNTAAPATPTVGSAYDVLHDIEEHIHSAQKVYPTLAAGITATGGAGAWQLGDFIEVVPASTITSTFDIHFLNVAAASASDTYELVLYYGESDTECGRARITRASGTNSVAPTPMTTPKIPANSKIRAKVASSSGGGDTLTFSIFYHTY